LAARPVAEWVALLGAAGIGAHAVISATQLVRDPWVAAHGLSVTREHAGGDVITTIGPPARLSRTPPSPGRPASPPGAAAPPARPGGGGAEVLALIGLGDRLDDLIAQGVVALE